MTTQAQKPCARCGCLFDVTVENFAPSRHIRGGFYPWCRSCTRAYQKDVYKTLRGQLAHRFRAARARATRFGLRFDLKLSHLLELWEKQNACCAISGLPFVLDDNAVGKQAFRPSLDRIQPTLGYVSGNVRLVLTIVNFGVNKWPLEDFLQMCEAVASRLETLKKGDASDPT